MHIEIHEFAARLVYRASFTHDAMRGKLVERERCAQACSGVALSQNEPASFCVKRSLR